VEKLFAMAGEYWADNTVNKIAYSAVDEKTRIAGK
jgi:hypothetical protein